MEKDSAGAHDMDVPHPAELRRRLGRGHVSYDFQLGGMNASFAFDPRLGFAGLMVVGNMSGWFLVEFLSEPPPQGTTDPVLVGRRKCSDEF